MDKLMSVSKTTENRREFLKSGLRSLVLGGLVFVSGFLSWRKAGSKKSGNYCETDLPCRKCSSLPGCTEKNAVKTRNNISNK